MSVPHLSPRLQRTLSAVYRFYDAFHFPIDDRTPPLGLPLEVSIPELRWKALRVEDDATYRFSALTMTRPAPAGANLAVEVLSPAGEYLSLEPILVTLPLPISTPPARLDFLIAKPLWPASSLRPPRGETAIRGRLRSPTSQSVANLKIEIWPGPAATPPPGTPYTRSDDDGEFLFRFPGLKHASGSPVSLRLRLEGGAIAVTPASLSLEAGRAHLLSFHRT